MSPPRAMRSRSRRRALARRFECEAQPERLEPPLSPPGGSRQVRPGGAAPRGDGAGAAPFTGGTAATRAPTPRCAGRWARGAATGAAHHAGPFRPPLAARDWSEPAGPAQPAPLIGCSRCQFGLSGQGDRVSLRALGPLRISPGPGPAAPSRPRPARPWGPCAEAAAGGSASRAGALRSRPGPSAGEGPGGPWGGRGPVPAPALPRAPAPAAPAAPDAVVPGPRSGEAGNGPGVPERCRRGFSSRPAVLGQGWGRGCRCVKLFPGSAQRHGRSCLGALR